MKRLITIIVILSLFIGNNAYAAIAYDNTATGKTAAASLTVSHTCAGSDRLLLVSVTTDNLANITGVTYNGTAMTQLAIATDKYTGRYAWYYLINPSTGANNIVASLSTARALIVSSVSYTGVLQTGFPDATSTGADTADSVTAYNQTLTTVADNTWSALTFRTGNGYALTGNSSSTIRQQPESTYLGAGAIVDSNGPRTPAGSKTLGVTSTGQFFGGGLMVSFAPSASAAAPAPASNIINFE